MTTFQAFIDDSGSKPVFVLSGYISRLDWWEDFSDRWQTLLDEPPQLDYFKMHEAARLSGQFGRMKAPARNERIKNFFSLIRIAVQASIIVVIPTANYENYIRGKVQKEWDNPGFIGLFDLIMKLLWNQTSLNSQDVLEFVFDNNEKLAATVPFWYMQMRKMLPPPIAALIGDSPKFEDDKKFLPLQAADTQSWYIRRLFAERFWNQPFRRELPKDIFAELDNVRTLSSIWLKTRCQDFASKNEAPETANTSQNQEKPIGELRNIHELLDYLQQSGEL